MSKVLKEITVIIGKYTNANGQEKNRYQKIGSIIDTKNGERLKMDVVPLVPGGWDGWAYLNEPRTDKPAGKPAVDFDDDIGF
jgi:hypothetical protein